MRKLINIFKAIAYTILEIIFVVICNIVIESNKIGEIILVFEILVIFTVFFCTLLILDKIKENQ